MLLFTIQMQPLLQANFILQTSSNKQIRNISSWYVCTSLISFFSLIFNTHFFPFHQLNPFFRFTLCVIIWSLDSREVINAIDTQSLVIIYHSHCHIILNGQRKELTSSSLSLFHHVFYRPTLTPLREPLVLSRNRNHGLPLNSQRTIPIGWTKGLRTSLSQMIKYSMGPRFVFMRT